MRSHSRLVGFVRAVIQLCGFTVLGLGIDVSYRG